MQSIPMQSINFNLSLEETIRNFWRYRTEGIVDQILISKARRLWWIFRWSTGCSILWAAKTKWSHQRDCYRLQLMLLSRVLKDTQRKYEQINKWDRNYVGIILQLSVFWKHSNMISYSNTYILQAFLLSLPLVFFYQWFMPEQYFCF